MKTAIFQAVTFFLMFFAFGVVMELKPWRGPRVVECQREREFKAGDIVAHKIERRFMYVVLGYADSLRVRVAFIASDRRRYEDAVYEAELVKVEVKR